MGNLWWWFQNLFYSTRMHFGQKQIWYMLRMLGNESAVDLANSPKPEFDHWRWVDYWEPSRKVIFFKRKVYKRALKELEPLLVTS